MQGRGTRAARPGGIETNETLTVVPEPRPEPSGALTKLTPTVHLTARSTGLLVAGLVAAVGFNAATLTLYPSPDVDEAWLAARAVGLIRTGFPFGTLDSGVIDRYAGYQTFFPLLGTWIQSLAIRIFDLGFFSVRLPSLLFGLLLLAAMYALGRQLAGPALGLITAILVALSLSFFYSAHLGRQDIFVAALGYGAIALYLAGRGPRLSAKSILAGLLVGLAFEIHPNAMIFGPTIVGLEVVEHGWSALRRPRLWGFVGGTCAGLAVFVALHLLPNPPAYSAIMGIVFASSKTPPILAGGPSAWLGSLADVGTLLLTASNVRLPIVIVGLAGLLRRPVAPVRPILVLIAVPIATFVVAVPVKAGAYAILLTPALDLAAATCLLWFWRELWTTRSVRSLRRRILGYASAATLAFLLAAGVALDTTGVNADAFREYWSLVDQIRTTIPADASLIGPQYYWIGLNNHRFLSWESLSYYRRYAPGSTLAEAFCGLGPNYFIVDRTIDRFSYDDQVMPPWAELIHLPRSELEDLLANRARLLDTIATKTFGSVRIYRLDRVCDR